MTIQSAILSESSALPHTYLLELANAGALDEISNSIGAIHHYIRNHGMVRDRKTNRPLFLVIYQTELHGPQNGFRLCLVHEGVEVDGADSAEVEQAAAPIAQGASEFVALGNSHAYST